MGGWTSRRRKGHAGALPEHSAHLLCISVPIQTFNTLKWHLHLSWKVVAFCGGEISEKHRRGLVFFCCISQIDGVLLSLAPSNGEEIRVETEIPTHFLLVKPFLFLPNQGWDEQVTWFKSNGLRRLTLALSESCLRYEHHPYTHKTLWIQFYMKQKTEKNL